MKQKKRIPFFERSSGWALRLADKRTEERVLPVRQSIAFIAMLSLAFLMLAGIYMTAHGIGGPYTADIATY